MKPRLAALCVACAATLAAGLVVGVGGAAADGDPGSDVLVNQPLFLGADAGISISQQVRLGALLQASAREGFPIRVAIIAGPQDLGAVTALWRKPQAYARFLGIELSLTYSGRLLVVMPDGFGFNWPGHPSASAYRILSHVAIASGGTGFTDATESAIRSLAAGAGVKLHVSGGAATPTAPAPQHGAPSSASTPTTVRAPGSGTDQLVAIIAVALIVAAALAFVARQRLRLRLETIVRGRRRPHRPRARVAVLGTATGVAGAIVIALILIGSPSSAQSSGLATNPDIDPGTPLSAPAPGFTLTDQFAHSVSLSSFRGKVVLLAFTDSECTTICPLTTTAMLDAKAMLGRAGDQVQLLGIDANPKATSLEDVFTYSQLHGMLATWHFLTGSLSQLQRVWHAYGVEAAIQGGEIAHTPALFVIAPDGRERKLYMTQQSYASIGQLGQLVAQEAADLLPGHPVVDSHLSYAQINGISPATAVKLPRTGGGQLAFGPGSAHLYAFFATWDQQITGLAAGLEGLGQYSSLARADGLPSLDAVDETSVEPPGALARFLAGLTQPLPYPVALDRTGQLGDGYEVQGLPWLVLVSPKGRIAWYYSVAALGWPKTGYLISQIREALAQAAGPPASLRAAQAQLSGSPPALAALHQQAAQLLGRQPALLARIRALRGYPIVINAWASWCVPCRSEFGLFASASAQYGRRVAFLGADTNDSASDARTFLGQHPVSYPSYQTTTTNIAALVPQGLQGLPTTIFLNRLGKLVYVHIGQYDSEGTLDGDIEGYALG